MGDLPLVEGASGVLDATGGTSIRIGPTSPATWKITNLAVATTSLLSGAGTVSDTTYALGVTDQSVNNSTVLVTDTDLTLPLLAATAYEVEFWVLFRTAVNCDVKTSWSVPTGATGLKTCHGSTDNAATFTSRTNTAVRISGDTFPTSITYQLDTSGNTQLCWERGIIVTTSAGTLALQFAQATATVGNMTRNATGSFLRATVIP